MTRASDNIFSVINGADECIQPTFGRLTVSINENNDVTSGKFYTAVALRVNGKAFALLIKLLPTDFRKFATDTSQPFGRRSVNHNHLKRHAGALFVYELEHLLNPRVILQNRYNIQACHNIASSC